MAKFLSINNADIYRSNQLIFSDLNWAINKGEHWFISGNNGAGKTELAKTLACKYFVRKGSIDYHFLQKELDEGQSIYDLRRRKIFLLSFADHHQLLNPQQHFYQQRFHSFDAESDTVGEYLKKLGFNEERTWDHQLMEVFKLRPLLPLATIKLSSGQMRKLLLISALLRQPQLLIIDNPYIGLDPPGRKIFNDLIDQLVEQFDIQLVLSGHVKVLPKCISHELHLHESAVKYKGARRSKNLDIKLPDTQTEITTLKNKSSEALIFLKQAFQKTSWQKDFGTIIGLENISIKYGNNQIFDKINWIVRQGEKWALVGNNGSGKSTILGMIAGDHPQAYANKVIVFGQKRGMRNNIWHIRKNIGFISPELHAYFPYDFSGFHIVASGLMEGYFINRKLKKEEQDIIVGLFDYFNVRQLANREYRQLSSGQQRLLFFMRALVKNPPLLLLDEPFQGLDEATIGRAKHLLNNILTDLHTAIFITHFKEEIPACVNQLFKI